MAKHKSKKRNIKKRVKKNVQKIKEITAEDILQNPALIYSPQFKALPLDRQLQLLAQVKQLKAMLGKPNGPIVPGASGGDPALYTKLNDLNTKASRQANENEQLRVQLEAQTAAYKREKDLNRELRQKAQQQKDDIDQADKIADLEQQNLRLDKQAQDTRATDLQNKINQKKQEAMHGEIKAKKMENVKLQAELKGYETPGYYAPSYSEGQQRMYIERLHQKRNSKLEKQAIYQNQINSYTENGEEDKAEDIEQRLNNTADTSNDVKEHVEPDEKEYKDDDKDDDNEDGNEDVEINDDALKKNFSEEEEELELNSPIIPIEDPTDPTLLEMSAIANDVNLNKEINTKKEQIAKYEELEKQKKENAELYERIIAQDRYKALDTTTSQINLEKAKKDVLNELDTFLDKVDNPNPIYRESLANAIAIAKGEAIIKAIRKKMIMDKAILESAAKDKEWVDKAKQKLIDVFNDPNQINSYYYDYDMWLAKINQIQTPVEVKKMFKYMDEAKINGQWLDKHEGILDGLHFWNISEYRKASQIQKEHIDKLWEVLEFLRDDFENRQVDKFYDSKSIEDLDPYIRDLSPSLNYNWINSRGYVREHSENPYKDDNNSSGCSVM